MNQEAEKYLQSINHRLSGVPEQDRDDILLEIKSHIHEATANGEPSAQVLARLGSPIKLAKAYSLGYRAEKLKPGDVFSNFDFYALSGLYGITVIPLLSFLAITFGAIAAFIPGCAAANLLGLAHVRMFVWGEASIPPGMLQILLSVAVGAFFVWLTYSCLDGIKGCVKKIATDYCNLRMAAQPAARHQG